MSKFATLISNGNSAFERRAGVLETQARIAQQAIIDNLKRDKSNLEISIINMTDFAPDSSDSLLPGSKNFNADEWANKLQEAKVTLWRVNIAIDIAEKTYNEFFKDDVNEQK